MTINKVASAPTKPTRDRIHGSAFRQRHCRPNLKLSGGDGGGPGCRGNQTASAPISLRISNPDRRLSSILTHQIVNILVRLFVDTLSEASFCTSTNWSTVSVRFVFPQVSPSGFVRHHRPASNLPTKAKILSVNPIPFSILAMVRCNCPRPSAVCSSKASM